MTTTFPTRRSSDFIVADDDVAAAGQRLIADRYRRRHAVVVGIEGAAGGDLHTSPEHDRSVIRRKLAARLYETVVAHPDGAAGPGLRSEEHTSELQSLMRISYAVFCLKTKKK